MSSAEGVGEQRWWPGLELLGCLVDRCVASDQLQGATDAPGDNAVHSGDLGHEFMAGHVNDRLLSVRRASLPPTDGGSRGVLRPSGGKAGYMTALLLASTALERTGIVFAVIGGIVAFLLIVLAIQWFVESGAAFTAMMWLIPITIVALIVRFIIGG